MEKKIVGYIPKLLFKFYLVLKDKFDPKPIVSYQEKISCEICFKLISKPETRLNFAPKSFKRFIKNEDYDMFIVINQRAINIINHVYSYTVYIENGDIWDDLLECFDTELEKRRQELEDEITNNIKHSLQNIFSKID